METKRAVSRTRCWARKAAQQITQQWSRGGAVVAVLASALFLIAAPIAQGAPGDLDPTFGNSGKVTTDIGGSEGDAAYGVAIQSDGKIIAVGGSTVSPFETDMALARYKPNGMLDTSFGGGDGIVKHELSCDCLFTDVVAQPDGKIISVGSWTQMFVLARYNADGTLDSTFGGGDGMVTNDFGFVALGQAIALQNDGKIVAVGSAGLQDQDFAIARYNSDGTLDTSFGGGDGMITSNFGGDDYASAVALLPDGKLLVGGDNPHWEDESYETYIANFVLARYNPNGTLDTSFGKGGKAVTDFDELDSLNDLALQSDGRVLAVGSQAHEEPDESYVGDFAIARYSASGILDTSFGGGDGKAGASFGTDSGAGGVVLQADEKFIAVGSSREPQVGSGDFAIARYNPNGTLDTSFGTGGKTTTSFGTYDFGADVALAADGGIVAAGNGNWDFALARYEGGGPPPPAQYTLSITGSGSGNGVVTSSPASIDCGSICSASFEEGETVVLTTNPDVGSTFAGWSGGGCTGTRTCEIVMSSDVDVTATFFAEELDEKDRNGESDGGSDSEEEDSTSQPSDGEQRAPDSSAPPPAAKPTRRSIAFVARVGKVNGNKALIRVRCGGATRCRGIAKVVAQIKTRRVIKRGGKKRVVRRKRNVVIGKGRFGLAPRRTVVLRLRLTNAGRKLVRRSGRRGLRVRLVGRGLKNRTVRLSAPQGKRSGKKRDQSNTSQTRGRARRGGTGRGAARERCIKAGLRMPEVTRAVMRGPGNYKHQDAEIVANYNESMNEAIQESCGDQWKVIRKGAVQVEDPHHPNRYHTMWGYTRSLHLPPSGVGQANLYYGRAGHGINKESNQWYRCSDRGTTDVRGLIIHNVVRNEPRKVYDFKDQPKLYRIVYPRIARKVMKVPVTVLPKNKRC